jgi:flagellar hook-associated protein 1 FlgK
MASLDRALSVALSGMDVAQQAILINSQNTANVDNKDYAKRIIKIDSLNSATEGKGVAVSAVIRNVDPYWVEEIRNQTSIVSYSSTIKEYLQKVQIVEGSVSTGETIDTTLNTRFADLMASLKNLTTDAQNESLMKKAVYSATLLSSTISSLATEYQKLRLESDQDLKLSFNRINDTLQTIYDVNLSITEYPVKDLELTLLEEKRELLLKDLAKEIDIKVYNNPDNTLSITTHDGKPLLDTNLYTINYTPMDMVEQLIEDQPFGDAQVYYSDQKTQKKLDIYTLVKGGLSSEIGSHETSQRGGVHALLHLRDTLLPNFISQLDLLANTMTEEFNKIHNTGTGFPGLQTIQTTTPIALNEERIYQGVVRIGIVNEQGEPVNYLPDENGYQPPFCPLDLDFGNLNIGKGPGFVDMQTIINEINEYFFYAPVLSRTELGNIEDIKIAATDNLSTSPNGIFKFDFELSNKSYQNSDFDVLSIQVYDSTNTLIPGALTSTLPTTYVSSMGRRARTTQEIVLDLSSGTGPFTIKAEVQVTANDGTVSHAIIDYQVNDNPPTPPGLNIINDRYVANFVIGDAVLHPPITTQRFAHAKLVDNNGNEITSNNSTGYLLFETSEDNYYLSFDDLTSKELGRPDQNSPSYIQGVEATNRGFGHFLGLNNFFVAHDDVQSSAINMKVRQDIQQDQYLLSRGRLIRSPSISQNVEVGDKTAEGSLTFAGLPSPGDTITINGQIFTFQTVAGADSEITIGADLPSTINNIIYTLSASNTYTIGVTDKATYLSNNLNSLMITYNTKGTLGNSFTIAANLSVPAIINNSPYSTAPEGTLIGGTNKTIQESLQPWTYEIGEGSNSVAEDLADLAFKVVEFEAYGNLLPSSEPFAQHIIDIINYTATETSRTNIVHAQQLSFLQAAISKFETTAGIDINHETFEALKYQQYYTACLKVILIVKELYQELFNVF